MYPPGYTTGDEDDEAPDGRFSSGHGCGSGWPSPDVPPCNYTPFYNSKSSKHKKHMGDMADWTLSQMDYDDEEWDDDIRPKVPDGFWKQKDGTLIEIKKMTESHLNNSIALCERKGIYGLKMPLIKERERRDAIMDNIRMKRDPLYAAFCAGWKAGSGAAYDEAYPDVGFSLPINKAEAYNEYKKSNNVDGIKRIP